MKWRKKSINRTIKQRKTWIKLNNETISGKEIYGSRYEIVDSIKILGELNYWKMAISRISEKSSTNISKENKW